MTFVLLAACSRPTLPDPVVERAVPSFAWNGEATAITLVGRDFWPAVSVDARDGDASVNPTYRAWLEGPDAGTEEVALLGVGIVDDQHLTATVPAGLRTGVWGLTVEGPSGARVSLPSGFRVTDQQAARLVLDPPRFVWSVEEEALIGLTLVDVDDRVVELPFEVVVVGTSETGPVTVTRGSLASIRPTPSGDGIRGSLVDGRATFGVSATVPGRVDLVVAPGDPYSPVVGDSLTLAFEPGGGLEVEFTLPGPGPFVAGQPLVASARVVDEFGNPVDDPTQVSLRTTCSGWFGSTLLAGDTAVAVVPTRASSAACPEDRLVVAEPSALTGTSDPFVVEPAAAARLSVFAAPASVRAGDLVNVLVIPEDPFGNDTAWAAAMTLEDSLGGLVDSDCVTVGDTRVCTARATRAAPQVVVRAIGDDGVAGAATPIEVLPDDVVAGVSLRVGGVATAGELLPVSLSALDAYGNVIPAGATSEAFALSDERGDAVCSRMGTLADGSAAFECAFTVARPDAVLTGTLDGFVAQAPLVVQNGALAWVTVVAPPAVVAGAPSVVTFDGADAWGNPYVVQADPTLALTDDLGSFGASSVVLDALGHAEATAPFTIAGTTRVHASQAGVELGRSDQVDVAAGPTVGLRIGVGAPWAWTDEPVSVTIESVDDWGNRTALDAPATVSSGTTSAPDVALPLINGAGSTTFTWPASALPDRLSVTAGGFDGEADVIVVRRCPGGPTADLVFSAGAPAGVACATAVDGGGVTADLTGSTRGALPLATFAAAVGGDSGRLDASGLVPLTLPGVGRHPVAALAVDTAACGAEAWGEAWSAPDDGSPAGPIPLSASVAPLPVAGSTTIDVVGATDCGGAPAAFQEVLLASSGGELAGTPTGRGLALGLDAFGNASVSLDASGTPLEAPTVSVVAASASGGARGELALDVSGDSVRPVVLDAEPVGSSSALIDGFTLTFSEPLLPGSVTPANVTVGSASVTSTSIAGAVVTVTLAAPLDGALGPHLLTVAASVRDQAGNRLAGDWGAGAAPWRSAFGGAVAPPVDPTCDDVSPATSRFRPDGDDGPDEEADAVSIGVSAPVPPSWWVIEVRDEAGGLVDQDWEVPTSAADRVWWDGRGLDGAVRPPGRYEVSVAADDGLGNRSAACVVAVQLEAR